MPSYQSRPMRQTDFRPREVMQKSYREPAISKPRDSGKEKNEVMEEINKQPYFSVKSLLIWPFSKW